MNTRPAKTIESEIVLELDPSPDNPRNSEGSFVTLTDGRLLFAYSRYYGESWADEATARICGRTSKDGGRTWSERDEVIVENEGRRNVMSVSLLRLQDGRIALWYLRKNSITNCRAYMRTSSDDGHTWTRASLCIPAPGYFVVNNDRVVQHHSGRLIIPAAYHRAKLPVQHNPKEMYAGFDGRSIAIFFLSDDNGRTWRESRDWWALPLRSGSGLQEPGLVELADGRLYAYCRTDAGYQYEMVSEDGGETWSPPQQASVFRSPCSPLSIKRISRTGDLLAIWNDPSQSTPGSQFLPKNTDNSTLLSQSWGRTPLVAAISRDEGKTWENHKLLESDPAHGYCYTAIHDADDAMLLAYCCGGGNQSAVLQNLRVRRVTVDWFYE
jgi:sialidase-1